MTEAPKTYIIQLQKNPNFCLGIDSAVAGAKVTLHRLGTTVLTQWVMDPETGYIRPVKNTNLVLDFSGDTPVNQRPIIIADPIPGRMGQKWNWVSSQPRILNQANEAYGIDNYNGVEREGNPIYLWQLGSDNDHQEWQRPSVGAVEKMLLAIAGKPE